MIRNLLTGAFFLLVVNGISANNGDLFRLIELKADTRIFYSDRNMITQNNEDFLYFVYRHDDEVCEITLYPEKNSQIRDLNLYRSADFDIIDSVINFNNEYYQFKIRFRDLTRSQFLKLVLPVTVDTGKIMYEIRLLPCTHTNASLNVQDNELFIGEEKEFEIITNNLNNIRYSNEWTKGKDIDYRIEERNGRLIAHVVANSLGVNKMEINLKTNKPSVNDQSVLNYDLPPVVSYFNIKNSRLQFLSVDKKEITLDETSRFEGILVQLDNSRFMTMNKTYRIENQEGPGGALIAEIFTKNQLANNRVLCILRVYNYHRNSDGYLYVKDGDEARFITNFSITPKTNISKISILREGKEWSENLSVYPGEQIDLKIQGEGLHKSDFHFEDITETITDTLIKNENEQTFKLRIPIDITKKQITIYAGQKPSGYYLNVREYQQPRPFDFISVNYGEMNKTISNIKGPVLFDKTVKDVVFSFNTDRIDSDNDLFGKQYLKFNVEITGMKNELIEMKTIDNINVCPSGRSPRYEYYDGKDCFREELSLNKYIRKSTHDLDEWSRIKITVQHDQSKYEGEGIKKDVEIILKKHYKFDIDVSFPAGLVTVYKTDITNEETGMVSRKTQFGNIWGVSMAMIAQFSFYHPDKIARLRPYKIGAGFIALNAFNLSSVDSNQDLAFVVLGSLYPTSKDNRLSFPLYLGGGYKLLDHSWMFLVGPGIRIRL